jgi:ABC-type oligopeptide transport system ATPase subunit
MHEGSFVEIGEANAVIETPKVGQTKAYVLDCMQLEQQSRGKNLRNVLLTGKSIFDL